MGRADRGELGTSGRFVAAAGASVVSAIVVNPFDVVKTRLQAQAAHSAEPVQHNPAFRIATAGLERCPPSCSTLPPVSHAANCSKFSSTLDGMQKIVRREGLRALWRGLDASLIMAVPAVGIYMPLYDIIIRRLDGMGGGGPLLAGALARTVAVLCTSPLELVRTRTQAVFHPQALTAAGRNVSLAGASPSLWSHLALGTNMSSLGRIQLLWRGVGATLARDVPFSAVYWGLLEPVRHSMLPSDGTLASPARTITANILAGSLGGAAAAAFTQPLDVVKTRMQLAEGKSRGTLSTLRAVAEREGMRGLFAGVTPRAMKAAPACAIVLVSYECMKLAVAKQSAEASET